MDVPELISRAREGRPRALGRLISLIEDADPRLPSVARALAPHTGRAWIIGVTGPPGVGKSTSTSALVTAYRARGLRVGVLAVDPSSPFSGGALLGDRVRMQEHATDKGVFIRSMAARGHLGGLAWATPQASRVLDAAGYDVVLIETVGVGQSELEVAALADTTIVLLAPGMGDGVQAAKAGILEVADLLVVNKADREGVNPTIRELKQMISLGARGRSGPWWRPEVIPTVAVTGQGVDQVVDAIAGHREWLSVHGGLAARRRRRARVEIEALVVDRLRSRLSGLSSLDELAERVADGGLDPYTAADTLLREAAEHG